MKNIVKLVPVLALAFALASAAGAELLRFEPGSLRALEAANAGRPFVLILWATDCAPCRRELALVARLQRERPELPVVLVASDDPGNEAAVLELLAEFGIGSRNAWIFGEAGAERLRYAIDPQWFGEVPRSYLYDAAANRLAISGPLTEERLLDWLDSSR